MAMISSAAFPKVALRNPPRAGPDRRASCSVPSPIRPASGTSEIAATMKVHADSGANTATAHDTGAAAINRFSLLSVRELSTGRQAWSAASRAGRYIPADPSGHIVSSTGRHVDCLIPERLLVLVVCARQQIEERVETAVERAAQLRDGAVEGVQREARGRAVGERQRRS